MYIHYYLTQFCIDCYYPYLYELQCNNIFSHKFIQFTFSPMLCVERTSTNVIAIPVIMAEDAQHLGWQSMLAFV